MNRVCLINKLLTAPAESKLLKVTPIGEYKCDYEYKKISDITEINNKMVCHHGDKAISVEEALCKLIHFNDDVEITDFTVVDYENGEVGLLLA